MGGGYDGAGHADNVQGRAAATLGSGTGRGEELGWGDCSRSAHLLLMSELPLTQGGLLVTSPKAKALSSLPHGFQDQWVVNSRCPSEQ